MNIKRSNIKGKTGAGTLALAAGILFLLAAPFRSCEPEDWLWSVDCNDCFGAEPDSALLIVYLSINEENDSVPLTFYRGTLEDGAIEWQDTATGGEYRHDGEIGRVYTVEAEYRSGNKKIIAYDSDKMTISDYGEDCGYPCYMVKGGIFDVKLVE
jgi:hypothetical protein